MTYKINDIENSFGIKISIKRIERPQGLPLYMTSGREFYKAKAAEIEFLIVCIPENERFGAVALEKQMAVYIEKTGQCTAYYFMRMSRAQRNALIQRGIPFIVVPNQLYLPFLGLSLSDEFIKERTVNLDKFSPAAQSLFLYFLYKVKDRSILKKEAADALNLTRMTITRASAQLEALNLIEEEKVGTEVHMCSVAKGREYLEMAEKYLVSPVFKTLTAEKNDSLLQLPIAGESALSKRSMLNSPRFPVRAVVKSNPIVKTIIDKDERWEEDTSIIKVELWKYDPELFTERGMVDPVSMTLSLRNIKDERVEGEIKDYMEAIEW